MNRATFAGLVCLVVSCGQQGGDIQKNQEETEGEIYEILEFVIKDQTFDKNFGLKIQPSERCNLGREDKEFLDELIFRPQIRDSISNKKEDFKVSVSLEFGLQSCLTKEDVDYMLYQKGIVKDFRWDNSRLGFNLDNHDNWFEFSVPLFSKDRSKAILLVRTLCKGLCGTGQTVLVEKEEGKWTSKTGYLYIH